MPTSAERKTTIMRLFTMENQCTLAGTASFMER